VNFKINNLNLEKISPKKEEEEEVFQNVFHKMTQKIANKRNQCLRY
jgi:hypothetical protein